MVCRWRKDLPWTVAREQTVCTNKAQFTTTSAAIGLKVEIKNLSFK
jgi:hypothetical protein